VEDMLERFEMRNFRREIERERERKKIGLNCE
jgi:hypothetical protein